MTPAVDPSPGHSFTAQALRADWPVWGACACALAYGALKLHWALGGSTLMAESPLRAEAIDDLLAREPSTVVGHWASVVLSVAAILVVAATTRPWLGALPRRLVVAFMWALAALMLVRGLGQIIGGVERLIRGVSDESAYTIYWDLFLWSPFFILWGTFWAAIGRSYAARTRPAP
jgi:hypothetical protein